MIKSEHSAETESIPECGLAKMLSVDQSSLHRNNCNTTPTDNNVLSSLRLLCYDRKNRIWLDTRKLSVGQNSKIVFFHQVKTNPIEVLFHFIKPVNKINEQGKDQIIFSET